MGYQQIKDLISDIDEFHNEAELREILQQILFICAILEENSWWQGNYYESFEEAYEDWRKN